MRRLAGRAVATGLVGGAFLWSGVALAAGNHVAINLPATIAAGAPGFNYTVTGSVNAKRAEHAVVVIYNQAGACPASFTAEAGVVPLDKHKEPAKGHFSVSELGGVSTNANNITYTCAYLYAQDKTGRKQLATAGVEFTTAATGTGVTVTRS